MPWLQAGTVPAGWHAVAGTERQRSRKMDRVQKFPPTFIFRTMSGYHVLTTHSFPVSSVSLLAILLCVSSWIDVCVILSLLAFCSLPRFAVLLSSSLLCPFVCLFIVPSSRCQGGTMVVLWKTVSPPLPFLFSSPLCPCPCPPPLKSWLDGTVPTCHRHRSHL